MRMPSYRNRFNPAGTVVAVAAITMLVTAFGCKRERSASPSPASLPPRTESTETQLAPSGHAAPPAAETTQRAEAIPPMPDTSKLEPAIAEHIKKEYAAAIEHPQDVSTVGELAMVYHAYGLLPAAEAIYKRAIVLAPDDFKWHYLLGHALLQSGDPQDAIPQLRHAMELRPSYLQAAVALANAYMRTKNFQQAVDVILPVYKEYSDSQVLGYTLGMAYMGLDKPIHAIQYLKPVLDENPRLGGVRLALSEAFRRLGQADHAEELVKGRTPNAAIPTMRDPELISIFRLATGSEAERRKGLAYLAVGEPAKAREHFEQALKFDPDDTAAMLGLADALRGVGETDRAADTLDDVLERDPRNLGALVGLAQIEIGRDEPDKAVDLVKRAAEVDPDDRAVVRLQGVLQAEHGNLDGLIESLEKLAQIDPDDGNVQFQLGKAYIVKKDLANAGPALQRAVDLMPENPLAADALGDVYWQRGDRKAAVEWSRRALEMRRDLPDALFRVALYDLDEGDYAAGLESLKQALEQRPDDRQMLDTLARVYAMCPDAQYRNADKAMNIARKLYGSDEQKMPVQGLNTLAAAYAEAGNFEEAVRLTKLAMDRAKGEQNVREVSRLARTLDRYQRGVHTYDQHMFPTQSQPAASAASQPATQPGD